MRRYILILTAGFAWAQQPPAIPSWLVPFPGTTPADQVAGRVAESSYTAAAKPDEILDHYKKLFATANLPFAPNFDGLGNTIRASAAECDLLLKIREQPSGTLVRISCAPKSTAPAGAPVTGSSGPVTNSQARAQRNFEQARQEQAERSRQMRAEFEAKSRARVASMDRYDQPVQPKPLPRALRWPGWLQSMEYGDTCGHPEPSPEARDNSLHCKYKTEAPMSKLHQFYLDLIKSHGYTVITAHLTAGSTTTGIKQNANGSIDAMIHTDDRPNGATEQIHVSYGRMYLNEPISVSIVLRAYPGS